MAVNSGRFQKGRSGNPAGRPPKSTVLIRQDSVPSAPVRRQDGYSNKFSGHGTSRDRRVYTRYGTEIVTDTEALDLWETEFLAARIIEAEPEEAYRRGWTMKLKDEELAEELWNWADELGVEAAMVDAREKERALGGSAIFPVLDGSLGDLSEPLDWDGISDVKALHVLEPRELQAIAFYDQLDDRGWSMPSMYMFQPLTSGFGNTFGSQPIHASRLVVFPGLRVSRQIRTGQRLGWGTSVLTRPKQVLADFGLAWASAATLLHEHGCGVLAMDEYAELMATTEGEEIVQRRLATMLMSKSSLRALVIDAKDKYDKQASSLGGASELLNEFKVLMSAASDGMPVSVLMGQSPGGLRTGDDDVRTWYGNVERRRAKKLRPRHAHVMKFLINAGNGPTGGKEPDHWSVEYPSLWSPSDKETAETRKTDMDRAVAAVGAGIASADDVAESFYGSDQYSGDIHINWQRRKAQAAIAAVSPDEISPEDRAAVGQDGGGDLTDEERQQLADLQSKYGSEDGGPLPDDDPEDDEDDFGDEDDPDYAEEDDDDEREDSDDGWRGDDFGVGVGGHGYNPYRAKDGKFGAGAHKVKPTTAERHAAAVTRATERVGKTQEWVGKTAAAMAKHGDKFSETLQAKRTAQTQVRDAFGKAQAASKLAQEKPTAKNIKAAQVATNKTTRLVAQVNKHDAALTKHSTAHAKASEANKKAVAAHGKATEAHAKLQAKAPADKAKAPAVKHETPVKAPDTKAPSTAKAVDHEAAAKESLDKAHASYKASLKSAQHASDSAADTDYAAAHEHLAQSKAHIEEMQGHFAAANASAAHGSPELQEHVKKSALAGKEEAVKGHSTLEEASRHSLSHAKIDVEFSESDQKLSYSRREAPEPGALKAGEYRELAAAFPGKLTLEQKVAVSNYSDHSDHILNPMLRQSKGQPDASAKLYGGDHAPDHVHTQRLEKRRERVSADKDTDMTVGTELRHLDAAIASHTFDHDVKTYRVLSDPGGKLMGKLTPGTTFQDHGYVSTTADKNFLNKFHTGDPAHRVDVHVTIKAGKKGAPMNDLSSYKGEKEVLLPRGSQFRVTHVVPATATSAKQVHLETI